MPSIEADKRALRVARATFQRGVGDLREVLAKQRPLLLKKKALLRKLEKKVADKGGELSEEVSSCSSLLDDSSSGSSGASDHVTTPVAKVKAKSKPEPVAKAKVKARELPPVKSSEEEEEASAEQDKGGGKKKARRSKADFPDVPPGEPAPRHRGKANAQGELYPARATPGVVRAASSFAAVSPVPPKATVLDAFGRSANDGRHSSKKEPRVWVLSACKCFTCVAITKFSLLESA